MKVWESGLDSSTKADSYEHSNEPSDGEFLDKLFRSDCPVDLVVSRTAECECSAPITANFVIGHNPDSCSFFPLPRQLSQPYYLISMFMLCPHILGFLTHIVKCYMHFLSHQLESVSGIRVLGTFQTRSCKNMRISFAVFVRM
jgi:hypothetical protein